MVGIELLDGGVEGLFKSHARLTTKGKRLHEGARHEQHRLGLCHHCAGLATLAQLASLEVGGKAVNKRLQLSIHDIGELMHA